MVNEQQEDLWNFINHAPNQDLDGTIKLMVPQILEVLFNSLKWSVEFEISVYSSMWQKGSFIKYDNLEKYIQVELRKKKSGFDLKLTFYEGKIISYGHELIKREEGLIPKELKRLMDVVREMGQPVKFNSRTVFD
jgi:hypothetical protein